MLPKTGDILESDFEVHQIPSKAFQMHEDTLAGYVDGKDAVRQAIYCILNTERYDGLIYDWNYGVELKDLFGKPMELVKSKIKKRIKEALMQDDRIQGVEAFSFEGSGRKLSVTFTVHTQYGDIGATREVNV